MVKPLSPSARMARVLSILLVVAGSGCAGNGSRPSIPGRGHSSTPATETQAQRDARQKLVDAAAALLHQGKDQQALDGPIATLLAEFPSGHQSGDTRYYSAATLQEALLYAADAKRKHLKAQVMGPQWAEAWFLRGFALDDLKRPREARAALQNAVDLAPWNAHYLNELAYTYETGGQWKQALDLYQQAEDGAQYAPEAMKAGDLGRAIRGQGYVLTEMGRLGQAEGAYRRALKVDPNDGKAKRELGYIAGLRQKEAASRAAARQASKSH